jgi:hypothetical protein
MTVPDAFTAPDEFCFCGYGADELSCLKETAGGC